jgi:branched-chain amino acid transport system substrate-binding protein
VTVKRFLIPLALLLAIILVAVGCPSTPAEPTTAAPTTAAPTTAAPTQKIPEAILVGCPMPLTGMFAGFGEGTVFGLQAAADDINAQGGVYVKEYDQKLPIKLVIVNEESDPAKAGTLAESLIVNDKVNYLVGGAIAPTLAPGVSTVADRYKTIFISCPGPMEVWLAMRQEVEGHWQYSWNTGLFAIATPYPEGDFRAGPGYTIVDTWKSMLDLFGDQTNKTAAVFAAEDPDGIAWYSLFPGALESWGYNVVGIDKKLGLVPMETTDFTSVINEWKANDCEILWGNAPGFFFGTLWKQCMALDFHPMIASIARAALFYEDVSAWGGDLPNGISVEIWWDPSFGDSVGIGDTTPESLTEAWSAATGRPLNQSIGPSYACIQVLVDAIERAGTLDTEKVQAALATTDLITMDSRIKFNENHFSGGPLAFGQWQKTDKPWVWECPVIISKHDFIKVTADPIFPIPYD